MTTETTSFHDESLAHRITLTRRGTAYFAQRLAELPDNDFDQNSLLSGWSRRHLLAHVGYNAAALCRLMDWAATGVENLMYQSTEQRAQEIESGARSDPATLRQFFGRTANQLDQKWQRLPAVAWSAVVRTAQGRQVPAAEAVWLRAREVWIHAVDLATSGRFTDFPSPVLHSLLDDIVEMWRRKNTGGGLVLAITGRQPIEVTAGSQPCLTVTGSLPAVTRWAAGRGAVNVSFSDGADAAPPTWL